MIPAGRMSIALPPSPRASILPSAYATGTPRAPASTPTAAGALTATGAGAGLGGVRWAAGAAPPSQAASLVSPRAPTALVPYSPVSAAAAALAAGLGGATAGGAAPASQAQGDVLSMTIAGGNFGGGSGGFGACSGPAVGGFGGSGSSGTRFRFGFGAVAQAPVFGAAALEHQVQAAAATATAAAATAIPLAVAGQALHGVSKRKADDASDAAAASSANAADLTMQDAAVVETPEAATPHELPAKRMRMSMGMGEMPPRMGSLSAAADAAGGITAGFGSPLGSVPPPSLPSPLLRLPSPYAAAYTAAAGGSGGGGGAPPPSGPPALDPLGQHRSWCPWVFTGGYGVWMGVVDGCLAALWAYSLTVFDDVVSECLPTW